MFETILIYNALLFFCLTTSYWGTTSRSRNIRKLLLFACYSAIFITGALRWDIGNDFYNYYKQGIVIQRLITQENIKLFSGHFEPIHIILSIIFHKFPYANLFVINSYLFLTLLLFYKINTRYNTHVIGIFTFLTFCYFFFCLDVIRQGLAIMIIIYIIPYLEQNKWSRYFIGVAIAGFIHYSAFIMIFGYFFLRAKPHTKTYLIIIAILLIGYQFLYWERFRLLFFRLVPYYTEYANSAWQLKTRHIGSGISVIIYTLIAASIIYTNRENNKVLSNFAFWGISLYLIACGNYNIERISYYFLYSLTISLPIAYKDTRYKLYYKFIFLLLFILFERRCTDDPRGNTPYRSVFSKEFDIQYLRPRKYAK